MMVWQVKVGKVGVVCITKDEKLAQMMFRIYRTTVQDRAQTFTFNEKVEISKDGNLIEKFTPNKEG